MKIWYIKKIYRFYIHKDQDLQRITITSPYANAVYDRTFKSDSDLRSDNLIEYRLDYKVSGTTYYAEAIMDKTVPNQWEALFGIIIILLVMFCLVFFSASFQNSVDSLVVVPLENIMTALRNSATVMLRSMKAMDQDDEDKVEDDEDGELETQMLERMVEKLVRIVSHTYNTDVSVGADDKNVDSATADWLSKTYAQGNKKVAQSSTQVMVNEEAKARRASTVASDFALPCPLIK